MLLVVCDKCNADNPEGADVCKACGARIGASSRHCVSCGRSIDWTAEVCPYCGHDFRVVASTSADKSLSTGLLVVLCIMSLLVPLAGIIVGIIYMSRDSPEERRVGKICIILGVLAILLSVGLAAALYVSMLGFSGGEMTTPQTLLTKTAVTDGYRFTFGHVDGIVAWSEVEFVLTDGEDSASWFAESSDLTGSGIVSQTYASAVISSTEVTLSITDLSGNGRIDAWDYFTLVSSTGFSATSDYTVQVIYLPTAQPMCLSSFSG